jgi:hypothetical protein
MNKENIADLLAKNARAITGGQVIRRKDNLIVDGFPDEANDLLSRVLLMNQEVDFTELTYDIKLYKVMSSNTIGSGKIDLINEVIAYHLEVFNINEPDIIYKYRKPVHALGNKASEPVSFIIDVFNLVDHPYQKHSNQVAKKKKQG